MKNRGLLD